MNLPDVTTFRAEMRDELTTDILPFWSDRMIDTKGGGWYGRIDGYGRLDATAPKGAILQARILWTFSAAYRVLHRKEYLDMATRAKRYLIDRFVDTEQGGVYWSLNPDGSPLDTKKQSYAIGFAIYGLSEYARATGDTESLTCCIGLYQALEQHSHDLDHGGYREALSRNWQPIADMRLSDKDENGSKTMNTHLHILEPYTNLYRIWPDETLRDNLERLIRLFLDTILNPVTHHLDLFFDDQWQGQRNLQSFGHDIEASWLLHEAALVLGNQRLLSEVERAVPMIGHAADEGLLENGAMIYERYLDTDRTDCELHWWVQCENVIGQYNLYQYFGDRSALARSVSGWQFIRDHLLDRDQGEWFWSLRPDGSINRDDDKAGFWKCPYHNSRMCLEMIERTTTFPF